MRVFSNPLKAIFRATTRPKPAAVRSSKSGGEGPDELHRRIAELEAQVERLSRTERELRETRDRLALAQKQAKLTYWRYSLESGRLTYSDEDAWDIFGMPKKTLPQSPEEMLAITLPEDVAHLRRAYEIADSGPSDYKVEYRIRRPDGDVRHLREVAEVEYDDDGKAVAHVGSVQDITELRQAEEALRSAQEQLLRRERLATLGQLTATVSHELRNPLGAIRTASDAIRKFHAEGDPKLLQAISLLERSQVRCERVIDDLLNFTRVRELNREIARIDDWLGDLLATYELPPGIVLHRQVGSAAEIAFDRDRLDRAVRNVIDNACHAMAEAAERETGGAARRLTVATRQLAGRLEMSFKDTGTGIAPDDRAKIWEPLYSTKSFGTGLGLSLVKQTMEQHGGGVEMDSEVGQGTEVVLWLPLDAETPCPASSPP